MTTKVEIETYLRQDIAALRKALQQIRANAVFVADCTSSPERKEYALIVAESAGKALGI